MLPLIPPPLKPTPINLLPSLHPLLIRHAGVACGLAVVPLAAHALAYFFGEELALVVFPVGHAFFFGLAAGFAGGLGAHGGAVGGGLGVPEDRGLGSVLMGVWKLFAWSVGGGVVAFAADTSYMLFSVVVGKCLEQVAVCSLYECVSLLTIRVCFVLSRCAVRVSLLAFSLPCAGVR